MKVGKKRSNILFNININGFIKDINTEINKNINILNKRIIKIRKNFVKYHEPYSEISQDYKNMIVKITLPNTFKKDILLKVNNGKIEVRGHNFVKEKKSRVLKGFYRSIDLPSNAIPDKAVAKFKSDRLIIKIPIAHQNK